MTFRWIEGVELARLEPVMARFGWTPLDPVFSKALIAEDEYGEIVGFNVLQVCLKSEPLWIDKTHRGEERGDLAMQLATKMAEHLKQAGATYWEVGSKSPFVERLCEANGMKKLEFPVYAYVGGVH